MSMVICNTVSQPCVTIGVLDDDVWTGAIVDIAVEALTIDVRVSVDIIVEVAYAVITSEFAVPVPYAVEVLVDVRLDVWTRVCAGVEILGIDVEMLADVDVNALTMTAVIITLEFTVPASLADSVPFR